MLFCFQDTIRAMDAEEVKQRMLQAAASNPEMISHFVVGPRPEPFVLSTIPWCVCGRCRQLERPKMNFCCGYVSCLTQKPEFRNLCMRHDVIEVANILNWAHKTNLPPNFEPSKFRNQAYRNFTLWQHSTMGPRRRVRAPACATVAIRGRFPELPGGQYKGYHSADSDSD